jgi:hypothetical protein
MGGGLMQLVAYGAQDIYLTGNPQITFFKIVYRRHTHFAVESIEQTFNGEADFGKKFTVTIARNGDLLGNITLEVDLGLNLVTKLRPVSYNHKIDDDDAKLSTGFIAQEMEQSLTELGVNKNEYYILQHKPNEDPFESQYWLDYTKMIPVLTKAIQEQQTLITALQEKLERNNIN